MSQHYILIVYGTRYGQTAKIAGRMSQVLAEEGHLAPIICAAAPPTGLLLSSYDAVLIGASVIRGNHQRCVEQFVEQHRDVLNRMPSAFFSVSASAAGSSDTDKRNAQRVLEAFLTKTGWHPRATATIAGAIMYTKYGFFTRKVLKMIAGRAGGPTDTSRDHELTDWGQVSRFARACAASLPERAESVVAQV